ncbi:Uncharacterised protein [uncultured archaeon]|nr:Uncharacterised protein [uncultured archaeon]
MNWIEIISLLASLASLAAFALFLWFSLDLWRQKRELKRRIVSLTGNEVGLSKRPIAIVIGIGKELNASVNDYLKDHNWGNVPVISWKSGSRWLEPKDYPEALININELKDQAMKIGVTEVLLFYAGPLDLAIYIGARFQNWVPVKVFQHSGKAGEEIYLLNITPEKDAAGLESLTDHLVKKI